MTRRARAVLTCAAAALSAAPDGAWAADGATGPVADEPPPTARAQAIEPLAAREPWKYSFTPFVWLFVVDGDIKKHGTTLDISTSLHDTIDLVQEHLDISFAGHLEAHRGDWGFFVDGCYLGFSDEMTASPSVLNAIGSATAEVDWDLHVMFLEFGVARRVADVAIGNRKAPLDLIGGARWNHLDYEADIDLVGSVAATAFEREVSPDFSTDWVDPFIGLRTDVPLAERVNLQLRADIGGGLGNGSDFAWNVVAGVTFQLNPCVDLYAGYRWYDIDREASGRKTDIQLHGPGIGVTIRF